jgi:hypothetical protein
MLFASAENIDNSLATGSCGILSSLRSVCSHMNSTIVFVRDLYSTSVLGRDTVTCFLELQEIKLDERKTTNPLVDL